MTKMVLSWCSSVARVSNKMLVLVFQWILETYQHAYHAGQGCEDSEDDSASDNIFYLFCKLQPNSVKLTILCLVISFLCVLWDMFKCVKMTEWRLIIIFENEVYVLTSLITLKLFILDTNYYSQSFSKQICFQ